MAAINAIAREWADEIRDGIAWVIVWKTGRSWNAQAVWLNSDTDTFEPEDLEQARKILEKDPKAVMLNGYYCGHFGEDMTVAELAAGIRWHYENGYNTLEGSTAFPPEPMEHPADLPADLPWYGKATSAEPDPYVYDGYMSPNNYELMCKHMEADRQQQEKDTRAAPGDLYIDGQRFTGKIAELEIPHFSPPDLALPELRSPPSMELTLTITPDTAQSTADTAAQPATRDNREPVLMPGARYETCQECGLEWNVSKQAAIAWSGYLCPVCRGKIRKETQAHESSPDKNAGSRHRRLRRDPFSPI